jgi:hypothetical protein
VDIARGSTVSGVSNTGGRFATAGSSCDFAAAIAAFGPAVPEAVYIPPTILARAYGVIE